MPVIHNWTDREKKKFNIKIIALIFIIIGIFLIPYFLLFQKKEIEKHENTQNVTGYFCLDPALPQNIKEIYENDETKNEINNKNCNTEIIRNPKDTNPYRLVSTKLYIPVTNITSDLETLTIEQLQDSLSTQKYKGYTILWNRQTDEYLRTKYNFGVGQSTYSDKEIEKRISSSKQYIAIIPFENKKVFEKEIKLNGYSVWEKDFSLMAYPLIDTIWIKVGQEEYERYFKEIIQAVGENNYEGDKIVTIISSGSSYVGSDLYQKYINEKNDPSYMVSNISSLTSSADIFHLSNEVSISNRCYQQENSIYLCSRESDLAVLKKLSVDVVGVTGNHILDFGLSSFENTLDWYSKNKIKYFGGGKDQKDANTARIFNVNGTKIAFLGYNYVTPYSYYATDTKAGNANVSKGILKENISKAKKNADIVVVDMQWGNEEDGKYQSYQTEQAQLAFKYGADIVQGVNSHQALGFHVYGSKSIYFGLGGFLNTKAKNGILVRHRFYDKEYIDTQIIPIQYDKTFKILLAGDKVKDTMLNTIFKQSYTYNEN